MLERSSKQRQLELTGFHRSEAHQEAVRRVYHFQTSSASALGWRNAPVLTKIRYCKPAYVRPVGVQVTWLNGRSFGGENRIPIVP